MNMMASTGRTLRLILNGKSAGDQVIREAVHAVRESGHQLEVRVTWEGGDAGRLAREAVHDSVDVVIAGGGDGTINEVANGLLQSEGKLTSAMAVLPLGTANDFASGCGIPTDNPEAALLLAAEGDIHNIDVGQMNDRIFVNVASGGFGAEVTANTPVEMKNLLGGGAYSLMGLVTALKMQPYRGKVTSADREDEGTLIVIAVGNGCQAGGGYQVAPNAILDDGLLDVMAVHDVEVSELGTLFSEIMNPQRADNRYVYYGQIASFQIEMLDELQFNLDGEPVRGKSFQFSVLPRALPFVLPEDAPIIGDA